MAPGKMVKATWNGVVLAECPEDKIVLLENNTYFPVDSIKKEYFKQNSETYTCPWKGVCNYFDITVNGKKNQSACWVYFDPKDAAKQIKGYYAFWKGVVISQ